MTIEIGKKYRVVAADECFKDYIGKVGVCSVVGKTGMFRIDFMNGALFFTSEQLEPA